MLGSGSLTKSVIFVSIGGGTFLRYWTSGEMILADSRPDDCSVSVNLILAAEGGYRVVTGPLP